MKFGRAPTSWNLRDLEQEWDSFDFRLNPPLGPTKPAVEKEQGDSDPELTTPSMKRCIVRIPSEKFLLYASPEMLEGCEKMLLSILDNDKDFVWVCCCPIFSPNNK